MVEKRWLNLPVSHQADRAKMRIEVKGEVVREFNIRLAPENPDYWVFCDISEFMGKTLKISYDGNDAGLDKIYQDDVVAEHETIYKEKYRPQFHFTANRG